MASRYVLRLAQSRGVRATTAAAAVASTFAASSLWLSTHDNDNDNGEEEQKGEQPAYSAVRYQHQAPSSAACRCESSSSSSSSSSSKPVPKSATKMAAALQRSKTLRRLDLATTKSRSLASAYALDPSSPPLGEGAFGAVHLATNRKTGEHVAIKRIPKSMTDLESFQREVNALLRIKRLGGHPHICSLQESFDEGSDYFLILDYVGGGEMFDHLIKNGAFSEADTSRLLRECASALAFLHGIGITHADLKPENLMLSTEQSSDAVVKLVDFGCAELTEGSDDDPLGGNNSMIAFGGDGGSRRGGGLTSAYRPPESQIKGAKVDPGVDMWAIGVILYIMLCGVHPFDLSGDAPDGVVERRVRKGDFPLRNSRITAHLSDSAVDLISKLMERNPKKRLTAAGMLEHPWVRGITASTDIITGSDQRLSKYRKFKTQLQQKFFEDVVNWSDDTEDEMRRKTSLIERSFRSLDEEQKGFISPSDIGLEGGEDDKDDNVDEGGGGGGGLSMSDFYNLLSENMVHKHFGKREVIYKEGDVGNEMYFIISGSIEVTTKSGSRATRTAGDFFGEGALLHPRRIRSATITCKTPVHAMCISREYFEKYLATSESGLLLTIKEKDKIRKRNRAKTILKLQKNLEDCEYQEGEALFSAGEEGDALYIVESGKVDVHVRGKHVFTATPGNLCGEHSVLTGQKRNSTAICASPEGCRAEKMSGKDFRTLLDSSPGMEDSLRELSIRRDFKKAVVHRLRKEFPYDNPKAAFDAVKGGSMRRQLTRKFKEKGDPDVLSLDDVSHLMRDMDKDYTDEEIQEVMDVVDLTGSGDISFEEFCKVFIANIKTMPGNMLVNSQDNIKPSDEAPALPLLVMTSSLLDLALRPTTSPIDVTSIYIVEEAFATFLAICLEDQFAGAGLEEIDVTVKALRYDGLLREGQRLTKDGFPDIPSTILTTTVRAKLRGIPDTISYESGYLDGLIIGAFRNATDGGRLQDFLGLSSHPILASVTGTEISLTSFAAFATGQASFAPSLPGTGAAVINGNDITPGVFYQDRPSSLPKKGSFDKNDPMDLAFVCMSGIIFFAMIILVYVHRLVKDKGGSHEEMIRHFVPGTDYSRATADAVYNDSSSDEGPGSGMLEGRTVQPKILLSSTGPVPTLAKYHYPIPKLRPRPQIKVNRYTNHATIGLNPIPEDQAFASPNYFDPENFRQSDSSMDIDSWLYEDADSLPAEDLDDSSCDTKDSFSRWNQWLQQVMVVNSGIRGELPEDTCDGSAGDGNADAYDLEDTCSGYSC